MRMILNSWFMLLLIESFGQMLDTRQSCRHLIAFFLCVPEASVGHTFVACELNRLFHPPETLVFPGEGTNVSAGGGGVDGRVGSIRSTELGLTFWQAALSHPAEGQEPCLARFSASPCISSALFRGLFISLVDFLISSPLDWSLSLVLLHRLNSF